MGDLLVHIAENEEAITREWSKALRDLPRSPYAQLDDEALTGSSRRSCQALLRVMQTGDMGDMADMLRASARVRIANGMTYSDNMAAWLLYRQVIQQVLAEHLREEDGWEQLVDRVDAVIDWVMTVLYDVYKKEQKLDAG